MKNNKTIDKIILKYSNRGMDKLQGVYPKEFCKEAAEKFITLNKGIVFLYTGFYVKGFAETDGPLGTYFLALGLEKLGFTPIVITDLYCENYFKNIKTLLIPLAGYNHETYAKILEKYKPICHFSIERLGRDKHNDYRNSRKVDIKEFTAPLDELYLMGSKNSPTFAIGDGGNEIGMGNFKDFLETKLNINPCIIKSDYPIIATVSNWGAYGFIAYLQLLTKKQLLPTFEEVEKYMDYILKLGCVDGIKCENVKSVDGKEWHTEEEILKNLNDATMIL